MYDRKVTTPTVKPDRIGWKPVGEFRIDGSRLYIGDSWMIGSAEVDAPVTPGICVKDLGDSGHISSRAIVMQQKTQRPVQFEMIEGTRQALLDWIRKRTLRPD